MSIPEVINATNSVACLSLLCQGAGVLHVLHASMFEWGGDAVTRKGEATQEFFCHWPLMFIDFPANVVCINFLLCEMVVMPCGA